MHPLQVEDGLSMAHASRILHLHGDGITLQDRVWALSLVVRERRMETSLRHTLGVPQGLLGHVHRGFGRQPCHRPSWRGMLWLSSPQEKNGHQCHLCHRPTGNAACHVHTHFGFSQRPLQHLRGTSGTIFGA